MGKGLAVFGVTAWYFGAILLLWKMRQDAMNAACQRTGALVTVLEYAPYKLRAADLLTVVPTIQAGYNIDVEFFETDWRTRDNFTLIVESDTVISGSTNWVGFRVTLNDPTQYSTTCFDSSGFDDFRFVAAAT